jgi:hypothetical protein
MKTFYGNGASLKTTTYSEEQSYLKPRPPEGVWYIMVIASAPRTEDRDFESPPEFEALGLYLYSAHCFYLFYQLDLNCSGVDGTNLFKNTLKCSQ